MKSADREGMLLGAYHFVTMNQDPAAQADSFVSRVKAVARAKGISQNRILLVGDFDTNSTPDRLVKFMTRVHDRTGVYPVTYLENSDGLRARLRNASQDQKRIIRRSPYWLALYGPGGTERTMSRAGALTPDSRRISTVSGATGRCGNTAASFGKRRLALQALQHRIMAQSEVLRRYVPSDGAQCI